MEKDNFNLFVGLVWLICGIYSKIKNKDSNSGGK